MISVLAVIEAESVINCMSENELSRPGLQDINSKSTLIFNMLFYVTYVHYKPIVFQISRQIVDILLRMPCNQQFAHKSYVLHF